MANISDKKKAYFSKLVELTETYSKILLVEADNVTSKQIQNVRATLRGRAEMLMGKNTMIRKCLKDNLEKNPSLEKLLYFIKGNIGFIFTNLEPTAVREVLIEHRVGAPARAGAIAPVKVVIPAGMTGLEPTQTSFFQTLNIPTKITKGAIELLQDVDLISVGDKVTASQAALLQKLNIRPFTYGLEIQYVFDNGSLYPAAVLDITDEDVLGHFATGVANVAAISLATKFPTIAAVPHMFINAFKNVLSIGLVTDYSFEAVEKVKAALAAGPAIAAAVTAAPAATVEETAAEEPEEEEEDMGFDLFD